MNKYHTFGPRFWALVLDSILLLPLGIADSVASEMTGGYSRLGLSISITIVYITYFVVMHAVFGQTVGKMLMKVRVLDLSESKMRPVQALLRSLPELMLSLASVAFMFFFIPRESIVDPAEFWRNPFQILMLLWAMADITVFFINDKRRALHDMIAGTVAVREFSEERA
ncbi:MAG: RDD family protein [Pyrinomonadaceae bacterium]